MSDIYRLIESVRMESEDPHNYGPAANVLAEAADALEETHFDLQAEVAAHSDTLDFLDELQVRNKVYVTTLGRILGEAVGPIGLGTAEETLAEIKALARDALYGKDAE